MTLVNKYKRLVNTYKTDYFNTVKGLLDLGWLPWEEDDFNESGGPWFEYLIHSDVCQQIKKYEISDDLNEANPLKVFTLDIDNCTTVLPPKDFVSTLKTEEDIFKSRLSLTTKYINVNLYSYSFFYLMFLKEGWKRVTVSNFTDNEIDLFVHPNYNKQLTYDNYKEAISNNSTEVINFNIWYDY